MSKNNISSSSSSGNSSDTQFYNTTQAHNVNSSLPVESISPSPDTIFEDVDKDALILPPTPHLRPKTPTIEPPKLTLTDKASSSSSSFASTDPVSIFNPMSDLNLDDLDILPSPSLSSTGSTAIASSSKNKGPTPPRL